MKRWRILLVLVVTFSLSACIKEYQYPEEQSDAVAEYMAGKLLDYDESYKLMLTPYEELSAVEAEKDITGSETEDVIEKPDGISAESKTEQPVSDETGEQYTISEVLGSKDFEIDYTGYRLVGVYPDEEDSPYFSLGAREGYQLLVATFSIKNTSSKERDFNLTNEEIDYQLDINKSTIYKPEFTLLENDLRYIDMTMEGKQTKEALLVFEIPKEAEFSYIHLKILNENKSNILKIK